MTTDNNTNDKAAISQDDGNGIFLPHSLFASLLWRKSPETKIVFITMLAMMDQGTGKVKATARDIAEAANVPVEATKKALVELAREQP